MRHTGSHKNRNQSSAENGNANARERSRFHDTRLEPGFRAMFSQVRRSTRSADAVQKGSETLLRHLAAFAQSLEKNLLSRDQLWLGDCGFAITLKWLDEFEGTVFPPLSWPQTMREYQAGLGQFAAVQAELKAYQPAITDYLERTL